MGETMAKSMKKRVFHGSGTRERIFLTAAELFTKKGYDAVSIREICEKVGVGKPALYYYFADKEALLLALIDEAYRLGFEYFSMNVKPHKQWIRKFHGLMQTAADYSRQYPALVRFFLLLPQMSLPPNVARKAEALKREEVKFFIELLHEGQREKCIPKGIDVKMLLVLILGSIQLMLTKPDSSRTAYPWQAHDFEDLFTFLNEHILCVS